MTWVEPGKWTCPACNRTIDIYASPPDIAACIKVVQQRHASAHHQAAAVLARLGLPDPHPRRRR